MTPKEAVDIAERALRRGSCSAHKRATEGCATCEASEEAVRVLRRRESDLAALVEAAGDLVQHIDEALDESCPDRACDMVYVADGGGWNHSDNCRVERVASILARIRIGARP